MPNLHNQYNATERKISQKNLQYMLNYIFFSNGCCLKGDHPRTIPAKFWLMLFSGFRGNLKMWKVVIVVAKTYMAFGQVSKNVIIWKWFLKYFSISLPPLFHPPIISFRKFSLDPTIGLKRLHIYTIMINSEISFTNLEG